IIRRDPKLANPATVEIHDTATRTLRGEFTLPTREAATISPDGRFVVAMRGNLLQVWDVRTREIVFFTPYGAARFSADGKTLVTGQCQQGFKCSVDSKTLLVVSPVRAEGYYALQHWDVATQKLVATWPDNLSSRAVPTLSPDGKVLAIATDSGCIRLWGTAT